MNDHFAEGFTAAEKRDLLDQELRRSDNSLQLLLVSLPLPLNSFDIRAQTQEKIKTVLYISEGLRSSVGELRLS